MAKEEAGEECIGQCWGMGSFNNKYEKPALILTLEPRNRRPRRVSYLRDQKYLIKAGTCCVGGRLEIKEISYGYKPESKRL